MSEDEKIKRLETRITELENENLFLKSMLKQQAVFGNKITEIVSEMDEITIFPVNSVRNHNLVIDIWGF